MHQLSSCVASLATAAGLLCTAGASAATFEIINIDPPGVGFNDPSPVAPVGGNPGTTLGEQRLNAYRRALDLWGSALKSAVPIHVVGSFSDFPPALCAGGVLAQAGTINVATNFPNAPQADTWYGIALANSLAGVDLAPGGVTEEDGFVGADIVAQFNGGIGQPDCIPGSTWYYGLDNNAPLGTVDFLNVFMHEVSHGLGFGNLISEADGLPPLFPESSFPDIYMRNTLDTDLGRTWDRLTPQEIVASATNTGKVVWAGREVTKSAPHVLDLFSSLRIRTPARIAAELESGEAQFGPAATERNFFGAVVLANDAGGASTTDGCEAIGRSVAGRIALVDRGSCSFLLKAQNAQAAGAVALLVANNSPGTFTMSGSDPAVTIPSLMISLADGNTIKANLPGVRLGIVVDRNRLVAANSANQVQLFAPQVIAPGSTLSHFDVTASPNLLMEPGLTPTLRASSNVDLTGQLFKDLGWQLESLKIGECDTHVPAISPVGDLLKVQIDQCHADSTRRSEFIGCVTHVAIGLRLQRFIEARDTSQMVRCAFTVRDP